MSENIETTATETPATFTSTHEIAERNLPRLVDGIEKLNRRAAKLGVTPITMTETGERFVTIPKGVREDSHGVMHPIFEDIIIRYVTVEITGQAPQVNGWSFAATLTSLEGTNMLSTVPGLDRSIPEAYRTAEPKCDHCGLARRRNETFVLYQADRWVQVGRQCLKDFLGYNDPHRLADYAALLAALQDLCSGCEDDGDGEGYSGGRRESWTPLMVYLPIVATCIRLYGWMSRTRAKESNAAETATASVAMTVLYPPRGSDDARKLSEETRAKANVADAETAQKALDWAQSIPVEVQDDYLHNVRTLAVKGLTNGRFSGIAASIIKAYQRTLQDAERAARTATERKTSKHFGTEGKREVFTLTLNAKITLESMYGITLLHKFTDADGNVAVWFASAGDAGQAMTEGQTYTVKATVKRHDQRDGVAQTIINRAVLYIPPAPKAKRVKKAPAAPQELPVCGCCHARAETLDNGFCPACIARIRPAVA